MRHRGDGGAAETARTDSRDAILLEVDSGGHIVAARGGVRELTGFAPADLLGRPLAELLRGTTPGRCRIRRRSGHPLPVEAAIWTSDPADDGAPRGCILALTDADAAERRDAVLRDDAAVARALLEVSETLQRRVGDPYLLDWTTTRALRLAAADWAGVLGMPDGGGAWRLLARAGDVAGDVPPLQLDPTSHPLLALLEPGGLVELDDCGREPLLPPALVTAAGLATAVCAPLSMGEHIVGVLVVGWRRPREPLAAREHELLVGIARIAGLALETAARLGSPVRAELRPRPATAPVSAAPVRSARRSLRA